MCTIILFMKEDDNASLISQTEISNVAQQHQRLSVSTEYQRSNHQPSSSVSEFYPNQTTHVDQSSPGGRKSNGQNNCLCWDCGQVFVDVESLQQHCITSSCCKQRDMLNFCHGNGILNCDESHDTSSSLSVESVTIQEHHNAIGQQTSGTLPTKDLPFCHFCAKDKNHIETHICTKLYTCNICNRAFSLKRNMERHRRIHTNEKPFVCGICNKAFTQLTSLKEHKHLHDNARNYSCHICNKTFKYRSNLYDHRKTNHRLTKAISGVSSLQPSVVQNISQISDTVAPEEVQDIHVSHAQTSLEETYTPQRPEFYLLDYPRKYVCDICNRPFSQSNNLKRHRRTHTKEKPYQCDVCFKSFTQSNTMKEHKKIHSDQKAYACTFCGKQFRQRSSLDKHKKSIATSEDVACSICGQKFQQKCTLRVHMSNHVVFLP